jgi:hypothetical protein
MFRLSFFRSLLAPTLLVILPAIGSAGIYSWVDEHGRKYYGDQIPPKQIKKNHKILDQQGRTLKNVKAQKTREQLLEEYRLAAISSEAERLRLRKLTQDRTLLRTFSNTEQIDKLLDDRTSLIDSAVVRAQIKMDKINIQLSKTKKRKRFLASQKKSPSEQLDLNIIEYNKQVARYQQQIERNMQKREKVISKFQQDRQRFIELKFEIAERKKAEALTKF